MSPNYGVPSLKGVITGPVRQISIPSISNHCSKEPTSDNETSELQEQKSLVVEDGTPLWTHNNDNNKSLYDMESSLSSAQDENDGLCSSDDDAPEKTHEVEVASEFTRMTVTRTVAFSTIQIKEYPIIVGDNPAVMMGVPITIDWTPVSEVLFSLEEYEGLRPTSRSSREFLMPSSRRADLLRSLGFSRRDIIEGTKAANLVRGQRRRTSETMKFSAAHETLERFKRATLNATVRRGAKSKERKFLECYDVDKCGSSLSKMDKEDQVTLSTLPMDDSVSLRGMTNRTATVRPRLGHCY